MYTSGIAVDQQKLTIMAGFSSILKRKWGKAALLVDDQMRKDIPDPLAIKMFRSKFRLLHLSDYSKAINNKDFWSKWPKLTYEEAMKQKTAIKVDVLKRLAGETAFPYPEILREILKNVKEGASIGVARGSDVRSDSTNAPSASESGAQISDAICKIIEEGFVMGPFKEENLPYSANRFSVIMAKIKPNNTARMILNLSRGFPHSVNSGIDKTDFPALMSSTESWIRVLFRNGKGAEMTKTDWAAAYKQLRVRPNEVWQQAFCWLGKVFYELCLVLVQSPVPACSTGLPSWSSTLSWSAPRFRPGVSYSTWMMSARLHLLAQAGPSCSLTPTRRSVTWSGSS
jgi:hypothetical protein